MTEKRSFVAKISKSGKGDLAIIIPRAKRDGLKSGDVVIVQPFDPND